MRKILSITLLLSLAPFTAQAMNDVCQKEFAPIIQSHGAAMQAGKSLPKNKPKTYEQALANSNAHCSFFNRLNASFNRVNTWMEKNKDFCQVPAENISQIKTSLATVSKNRTAACGAVAQLKSQKSKAERQQALAQEQQKSQGQNPFASPSTATRQNDPFNPQISRKPQLSL